MSQSRWSPSVVVLGLLMVSFGWALVVPLSLVAPPSAADVAVLVAGLGVFGTALLLVLHAAVSPLPPVGGVRWRVAALVAASLVMWLPLHLWAEPGERPWAWLAGFAVAACGLVTVRAGLLAAGVLGAAAVLGGTAFGSVVPNLLTVLGSAAVLWLTCQGFVWLLRLLRAVQAGREAEAELAVAEERLRSSRELHDVLGHRLGLIALRAELAAGAARSDPDRAVAEMEGVRELAAQTLGEARRAVHGGAVADLAEQLRTAQLVLGSAGIRAVVEADARLVEALEQWQSQLFATVLREGVTNLLRHSDATRAWVRLSRSDTEVGLVLANDGVRAPRPGRGLEPGGSGLASLSARCRALDSRLRAGPDGRGRFELAVAAPAQRVPA